MLDAELKLKFLESVINKLPALVYYKNLQGKYLWCNDAQAKILKLPHADDIVGKTDFDFLDPTEAEKLRRNDQWIMSGMNHAIDKPLIEEIILSAGEIAVFESVKIPVRDVAGQIVGLIGISQNVTAQKKAERLTIENEAHKVQLLEQQKFSKTVDQVAHDIRSPLASLLMILKSCQTIPEPQRIALRDAATSINDIANNLLQQYKIKEKLEVPGIEEKKYLLVSATLLEVLTDKKYQYQSLPVDFEHVFDQSGYFAFVEINGSDFKRMISNLINNSVDAFGSKEGVVTLKLEASGPDKVKIILQDNGKGMPSHIIEKIMSNVAVTDGKQGGHGIGMRQVKETLEAAHGKMEIQSVVGQGTTITLTFPRALAPHWIAEEIVLNPDDVIVILDDDNSIHGAWDAHFQAVLKNQNNIQRKHFSIGQAAIDFINSLDDDAKQKIFLLTDYELLKQGLNGLDVISKSGVGRAVLVTSHYASSNVREMAAKLGIKILPKQMASEVPIKINQDCHASEGEHPEISKQVDCVLVEDNLSFAESIIAYLKATKSTEGREYQIDHYTDPRTFLENLSRYSKGTIISLDNDFGLPGLDGLQLAERLHQQGYTKLYLLSGTEFEAGEVPTYLTFILKTDMDGIARI